MEAVRPKSPMDTTGEWWFLPSLGEKQKKEYFPKKG